MAKVQIIVATDQPHEVCAVTGWFERWRPFLTAVSENSRCGCYVDICDIEGPAEVLAELPSEVVAYRGAQP